MPVCHPPAQPRCQPQRFGEFQTFLSRGSCCPRHSQGNPPSPQLGAGTGTVSSQHQTQAHGKRACRAGGLAVAPQKTLTASLKRHISYSDHPLSHGCAYICTYIHIGVLLRAVTGTWCPPPMSAGRIRQRRLAGCILLSGVASLGTGSFPPPASPQLHEAITASWWRQNPGGAPRIE